MMRQRAVKYSCQKYEANCIYLIEGLRDFLLNKDTAQFPSFHSKDDPDRATTYFCLRLYFGSSEENFLSAYIVNHCGSKIYMHTCQISLISAKFVTIYQRDLRDPHFVGGRIGWKKFFPIKELIKTVLEDEVSEDAEFTITVKLVYSGNFVEEAYECNEDWRGDDYESSDSCKSVINAKPPGLQQPSELSVDMLKLLESGDDSDVAFSIANEIIPAHKLILSSRCRFFRGMFASKMRECKEEMIKIEEFDVEDFHAMLKYIYSGLPPQDINERCRSLIPLSDYYMLDGLKKLCSDALRINLSLSNAAETVLLAHKYNCVELLRECFLKIRELKEVKRLIIFKSHDDLMDQYIHFLSEADL